MKTKRIVALALAAALTVGGVAPTLAAPADYKFGEQQADETVNKYNKALAEQRKVYDKADEDYTKAEEDHATAINKRKDAQKAAGVAAGQLEVAKVNVENQDKLMAKKNNEVEENKKAYNTAKIEFTKKRHRAPLASEEHYDDAIQKQSDRVWALWKAADAEDKAKGNAGYNDYATLAAADKDFKAEAQKLADLKRDKEVWTEELKELTEANYDLTQEYDALKKAKKSLEDIQDGKELDLKLANEKYEAAKQAEAKAFVAKEEAQEKLKNEKSKYDRLANIGSKLTIKYINEKIVPKLAELSANDVIGYILGSLALEDGWFSPDVYKAAGIDKKYVDTYRSVLGDQGALDPAGDESKAPESESKAPESKAPERKAPESSEKAPAKENKKEDKKDNKKAKKVAPKTGDISVLAYAGTAVLAAGAFVASKKRK